MLKSKSIMMTMAALAAVGLVPIVTSTAMADTKFEIDNSIHVNESCKEHCVNNGDIKQEANLEYSQTTGEHLSGDVLTVNVDHLHGHKVTISTDVIETGAHAEKTVEDYDNYYAIFHWYDGRAPLGSTYKSCVFDHKTDDTTCKTKSHEQTTETINLNND